MLITEAPIRATTGSGHRTTATVLGAALAVAVLGQGAFHPGPFLLCAVLVVAAGCCALRERSRTPVARGPLLAAGLLGAFAAWALVRAAVSGDALLGLPTAAVAGVLAIAIVIAAGLGPAARDLLRGVVLTLGVVVAAAGWIGTALHLAPLSIPGVGLWRASSTLTYANAAAAVLVTVLIVAVTRVEDRLHRRLLVAVLLLGLAATLSRGGALALAVGLVVLACTPAGRTRLRSLAPVPFAAGLGFVGLLPSLPEGATPQPLLAAAGLAAGAGLLLRGTPRLAALAAAPVLAVTGLVVGPWGSPPVDTAVVAIADTRLNGDSSARVDLARVTLEQFRTAPVTGIGPGRLDLTYLDHAGNRVHAWFTHLEYLQVATETGLVGLALVLAAAAALAFGHRSAAGLAILAALAVQSALDFLWHIPAVPLLACAAVVLISPHPTDEPHPTHKEIS
ncbi:O-antigen ligase family protein [Pseudonocardia oroxyli]|uniref:O-Antigen ligase n=1 Tax=Pseudonocardia oroxyli TaxID=366584 RepID=A0A1G8DEZ8_PSEOR|nr:O-antigen ligase family protein [Pseudonocardia oroxyli]SDH56275.1 O-Antigen ligase [Pseudonocardia oroxyli]